MPFARYGLTLLSILVLVAQSGMAQQSTPPKPTDAKSEVLAVVNGHEITQMDIDQLVQQYRPEARGRAAKNKGQVMRNMVTLEILSQEAKKQHLDQDPLIQAQIRLRINDVLARTLVQKSIEEHAAVTDETIRKHYEASKDKYTVSEEITASHILVKSESEAQEVLEDLKQGKDFAEVAKARSIGPSAPKGGALGTFGRGRMVPAFEAAAFALQKDEVSGPVQTQFGYHIIKVTDRTAARTKPLDEVREDVRNALVSRYVDTLLTDMRHKAKIQVIHPDYAFQ
jgi:peptidyl-prolyl cis-trans isomerase C